MGISAAVRPPAQTPGERLRPARGPLATLPLLAAATALLVAPACNPVVVRRGETAPADVTVPTQPFGTVNILGIGRADAEGRIVLRATGISVARGETAMIGLMGPGMAPGTGFVVIGIGFRASVVRFAETDGGAGVPIPAAVLSLVVPAETPPGLYTIVAVRGFEMAVLSGGIEVV